MTVKNQHRATNSAVAVLEAVSLGHNYGYAITQFTGVTSGTLYPMLATLTARGLLSCRVESGDAVALQRPLRRFYRLTAAGLRELNRMQGRRMSA